MDDRYNASIYWILREQRGIYSKSSLNARDVEKIALWRMVRMVADVWGLSHRDVARDVIDYFHVGEHGGKRVPTDYQRSAAPINLAVIDKYDGE
jgi:hypothetical protein